MAKTTAYMNHGRWLHNCLKCNTPLPVTRSVCPICYPDAAAQLMQLVRGNLFRPVADTEKRGQAQAQAEAAGELYEPQYPPDKTRIERVLRERKRQNMNWEPGESLDLLIADNIQHGDPVPELTNGL